MTNTNPTAITGNVGVSPGTSVTGFLPGVVAGGTIHAGDAVAAAQNDLTTAYNAVAGTTHNVDLTARTDAWFLQRPKPRKEIQK